MKSVYVTFDTLDPNNGAGLVSLHEINALKSISDCEVYQRKDITGASEYEFNPFLYDYFAAQKIPGYGSLCDILHLSCSPGNAILGRVHPTKYTVNIVAHNLEESIKEHELFYGKGSYQYKHNTDPYLHGLLLKHASYADKIFTPSSTSAEWIRKNIRYENICVIPHGTEIPESYGPYPEKFTVGYLGAWGPDKGIGYLTSAWNRNPRGELLLGGICCKVLEQSYKLVPKEFPSTRLLGWVDKVSDFYNQLSVYVQPSVTEGFGIEILEAMAHGRPVIASRGAGGADAISDGIDGFVVPPRSIDRLAEKIKFFFDNPKLISMMGNNARVKALQYSWDKIEQKYIKAYRGLLE
jgi:glycosyltransferase involved in cell wall biosynthesis